MTKVSPSFTVLVGESLGKRFALSAALSIVGLGLLQLPRLDTGASSSVPLLGIVLALLSSLAGAVYQVYFKVLLQKGLTKSAIVFLRLMGVTLVLGCVLLARPELFRFDLLSRTAMVGLLGFSAPLFLSLTIIQRVQVQSFAMLLFIFPMLTLLMSASVGYAQLYLSDIVAGGLLLIAIALYEHRSDR